MTTAKRNLAIVDNSEWLKYTHRQFVDWYSENRSYFNQRNMNMKSSSHLMAISQRCKGYRDFYPLIFLSFYIPSDHAKSINCFRLQTSEANTYVNKEYKREKPQSIWTCNYM